MTDEVNTRLQVRKLPDDLAAWLASRSERMHTGSHNQQAVVELGLWKSALQLELRRIRLTLPQARVIAAVCSSWMLDAAIAVGPGSGLVFAECYDAFRIAREHDHLGVSSYAAQYGIDEQALLDYLGGLGPVADAALRDAIVRWWEADSREDTFEGFRKVGLRLYDPQCDPEDCDGYEDDELEAAGGPS